MRMFAQFFNQGGDPFGEMFGGGGGGGPQMFFNMGGGGGHGMEEMYFPGGGGGRRGEYLKFSVYLVCVFVKKGTQETLFFRPSAARSYCST